MAIAVTNIHNQTFTAPAAPVTTSSWTSVTGRYYLTDADVYYDAVISNVTSTNGITWTKIYDGAGVRPCIWGGLCTSGSSGTMTVTATSYGGSNLIVNIDEVTGHDTTGTIVQNGGASGGSTSLSVTLSAITGGNGTYMLTVGTTTNTSEAGWTNVSTQTFGGGSFVGRTAYKAAGDNTPSFTANIGAYTIAAIEIKVAAAGAASNTSQKTLMLMGYGI